MKKNMYLITALESLTCLNVESPSTRGIIDKLFFATIKRMNEKAVINSGSIGVKFR